MLHGNIVFINTTIYTLSFLMLLTMNRFHPTSIFQHWITAGFLLFILPGSLSAGDSTSYSENRHGSIVVTIKPLYSLVAHLTEGVTTPSLLMKQTQSPHHYNMRPSERYLLSNARMIVWLGPLMESYLSKIIQQQNTATVITALHADELKILSRRRQHSHEEHDSSSIAITDTHMMDPHIWLSIQNAKAISRQIAGALIVDDPANTETYKNNLQLLLSKIEQTEAFIKSTLDNNKQAFIAYHDAFQYFEEENGLNYIDSVNYDDETGTSLKQIRQIMASIEKNNIQCLVYQDPRPDIIDSLTRQTSVKATALDPLGTNVTNDRNAWFEIMRQLAVNFKQCLGA